jgi:hypothetical protein
MLHVNGGIWRNVHLTATASALISITAAGGTNGGGSVGLGVLAITD